MENRLKTFIKASRYLYPPVKFAKTRLHLEVLSSAWHLHERRKEINSYLQANTVQMLQIGAGSNILPGWLNTDLVPTPGSSIPLDAAKPYPFPDETFDYVFSEHMIEHLPYSQGLFMLRESFRILKPGGWIRLATPDLGFLVELYGQEKTEIQQKYVRFAVDHWWQDEGIYEDTFVINNFFRNWGHQFIYDPKTLRGALERVGFTEITCCRPGQSEHPALRNLEYHGKVIGDDMNALETFVLEARRP